MISIENITKAYLHKGHLKYIARNASAVIPTGRSVALLGRNGAGKSTLLELIAGTKNPDRGRVRVTGTISWPIGLASGTHPELTGVQNTRFIARVYGVDTDELVDFVSDFAELGKTIYQPVRTYSSGQRARLAFGISMGIKFDTYLVDEVTSVGDVSFKHKSAALFRSRMAGSGAIYVSHSTGNVRANCQSGMVLEGGKLTWYEDVEEAIEVHERNLLGANYDKTTSNVDDDD